MGKSSELKDLRKQLRGIVKEAMPEVVSHELTIEISKKLEALLAARMTELEKHVKSVMHEMNERNKDVQGYLVRAATQGAVQGQKDTVEGNNK